MNDNFKYLKEKYFSTEKRFLGIDYGDVNIGVALSDTGRQIASPFKMLKNKNYKALFVEIKEIVDEMDVAVVAVGLPLQMDGREGETAGKVRKFVEMLEEAVPYVEIVLVDERMSSVMAEKMLVREFDLSRKKRKNVLDKIAAAEILQRLLDAI